MVITATAKDFPCERCEVRNTAICGALNDDELRVFNAAATEVKLAPGQTVFMEDDPASHLFSITSGTIRMSKSLPDGRRQITGFLFSGDFLGLSVDGTYAYGAEVISHARLCRFEREHMLSLLDEFPKLEHRLLELASNELAEAQEQMMLLGRKSAVERLATVLVRLSRRFGHVRLDQLGDGDGGVSLDIDISRADLGDYLGLTTETVSRTFHALQEQGLIELPQARKIVIRDANALLEFTGD